MLHMPQWESDIAHFESWPQRSTYIQDIFYNYLKLFISTWLIVSQQPVLPDVLVVHWQWEALKNTEVLLLAGFSWLVVRRSLISEHSGLYDKKITGGVWHFQTGVDLTLTLFFRKALVLTSINWLFLSGLIISVLHLSITQINHVSHFLCYIFLIVDFRPVDDLMLFSEKCFRE